MIAIEVAHSNLRGVGAETDVDRIRQVALAVAQHHEDPVVRACDHVEFAVAVEIAGGDAEPGEQGIAVGYRRLERTVAFAQQDVSGDAGDYQIEFAVAVEVANHRSSALRRRGDGSFERAVTVA